MRIRVTSVDHAPDELYQQTPFQAVLVRQLPGPDRPDYWLAALSTPLRWLRHGTETRVTHVILAARWLGTEIGEGIWELPVKVLYVVDPSAIQDAALDLAKCEYVAIGTATEGGNLRGGFRWAREVGRSLLVAIRGRG